MSTYSPPKHFIRGLEPKESMEIGFEVGWKNRIAAIMLNILGEPENPITFDTKLKEDLKMDDLDLVEAIMYIEKEFDIYEIPDSISETWITIKDITTYLKQILIK
jgi:acyl carrier protein